MQNKNYAIIAGYASTFNNIDKNNHIVLKDALLYNKNIPILLQHDFQKQIGTILNLQSDFYGLYVEAAFNLNTPLKQRVYKLIKNNSIHGMSVGLRTLKSKFENNIMRIEKAKVIEISLTGKPVNTFCKIDFCEEFYL